MDNTQSRNETLVFGLDIGTRSIVGVVGYMERNRFKVIAMAEQKHETRAMLDGQIHDIYKVGDTIRKVKNSLENQLERELSDVCIAAAGRVLKTVNSSAEYEFEEETRVTQEHIYSLNLLAVENAHNKINEKEDKARFYCVGNTPIRYQLNGYDINNLEGHKASKISVELIATFLPEEVVDGLYEAVEYAGLNVASLTLEPIAAMNIAIPEQYRLLNIGLVDVGAGTSDICLTKDGCIIAYGMIPCAGDEITECIAKTYLVDFNTAEKIKMSASTKKKGLVTFKDIMGITQKVDALEIRNAAADVVNAMAKDVAEKIIELNGDKPVNAVFVVGGGGKIPGYTERVADCLGIPHQRVAVRGEEVLTAVDFQVDNFKKDSLYVTPVGICTNYYTQKNNFVFVTVNKERIKLYDTSNLTVVDAVMQIGFPNEKLFPRRGAEINFTVNGKSRLVRGSAGEGAVVTLNGRPANLHTPIEQNDIIVVTESTVGEPASITIGQLEEFNSQITFIVNDKTIVCPRFAYVNGELKSEFYDINDGDKIRMENFYTVAQLFEFLDLDYKTLNVTVNNEPADKNTKVYENFTVRTSSLEEYNENIMASEKLQESEETDDKVAEEPVIQLQDITITVNGQSVVLSGKPDYIVVDLFQFYPFDLTMVRGNLVFLHNGNDADYSSPLNDGDVIELRWEDK
ncbi:MAG: cell division FtsA domain-containing protein [Lachnospira eligens]